METQIRAAPWTDLQGQVHAHSHGHAVTAFEDCVCFHLLSIFSNEAAERQKYYISHLIKKPCKVLIKNFANHIEQLNSYIPVPLGLIDSPQGVNLKRVEALDEPKLAQLLLQLVPQAHQDQYSLIKGLIHLNVRSLLDTLETIENMDNHFPRKPEKSEEKSGDKKRKGSSKQDGDPRKMKKSAKFCALCDKHGGAKTTHNTGDCRKYDKHCTFEKDFKKDTFKSKKPNRQSYQMIADNLKKMKLEVKELKKKSKKSKKRERNNSSDDSNSSRSIGLGSTGELVHLADVENKFKTA